MTPRSVFFAVGLSFAYLPAFAASLACTPPSTSCADPAGTGNTIVGDYGYYSSDSIIDLNTDPNTVLAESVIVGANNLLAASNSGNTIVGSNNGANGALGNLGIYGNRNVVQSDDSNILIQGNGNTVSGTQGKNWGLSIVGDSNQATSSSGTIAGTANVVDNMTRGTVDGYLNTVTNAADAVVAGNSNSVQGDRTITVGNGNSNTGASGLIVGNGSTNPVEGGVIVGNNSALGADATNSVIIGNNGYTDRADTVDVGGRTISNVAPGVLGTDAVNLNQLQAGILSANHYTDQVFSKVNKRINQSGAVASAMGIMAGTAAGNAQAGLNRIAMATASYNGQSALAFGYQRTLRDRISLTLGASFSGHERVIGAGASFGW
jgi:hypothetical protein